MAQTNAQCRHARRCNLMIANALDAAPTREEMEIKADKIFAKIMWLKARMYEIDTMTCRYDGYEYITYQ